MPGWTPVDFFVLRHGQTTWNARGIIQGQADAPLDDVGRAQAQALADFLAGDGDASLSPGGKSAFPRPGLPVVTSDLSRAVDTARVLADALVRARARDDARSRRVSSDEAEPERLHRTPKLRERHVGRLQGLPRADAKASDPVAWRAFRSRDDSQRVPGEGGESYDDLWDRVVGFVEARAAAAAAAAARNRDRSRAPPIALVTHGGVARVLLDRCARDEAALEAFVAGGVSRRDACAAADAAAHETKTAVFLKPEPETAGKRVARRLPGTVSNCSVGVIRAHVPRVGRRGVEDVEEQMWEAVTWGNDSFLASAGLAGNAARAAGNDYA